MHQPSAGSRRVLLLTDDLANGGAERQLTMLAKYLPPTWNRRVWSLDDGPFAPVIRADGTPLRIRQRTSRIDPLPVLDLLRLVHRWQPDVLHAWGWMSSIAAGLVGRALGVPVVDGTIRGGYIPTGVHGAGKVAVRTATRVIANSRAGLVAWGVDERRGRVVYNGFDPDRFSLTTRVEPREDGRFSVVMTGRMQWEKDFRGLLAAAQVLAATEPEGWRFILVGSGPDRQALVEAAAPLVDTGSVEFPAPTMEVLPVVRRADAAVLLSAPAHAEGCSNSILEYMACGLPVVCNDSGGNRELVEHGASGFILSTAAPDAVAGALRRLRDNPTEAVAMGKRGQQRLHTAFSVEQMVAGTVAVYDECLRLRRGRRFMG
jgi:glycosyltransferase involved in cell wall biosynthesis